ncbi:MAG: T9SS type A sorting domain-containing protein, partial [Cyanothece sp. SIO1E1]|nr:T9SS type A sorting domain-containing protein [Cyanothece sp. SIO1E1]
EVASALYEQKSQIQVYPNPVADGLVYVEYKLAQSGPVTIEWINASGQVLSREVKEMQAGHQRAQLSIDAWPAGLYNLRLSSLTEQHNFQLSKQ